ncbi:MAG: hypothetical protein RHS_2329 [Robinsoniella sp. RHS]|nr:MAG: hypothetical protein RHS_2329 [Robinsoniella sp. RHS]
MTAMIKLPVNIMPEFEHGYNDFSAIFIPILQASLQYCHNQTG